MGLYRFHVLFFCFFAFFWNATFSFGQKAFSLDDSLNIDQEVNLSPYLYIYDNNELSLFSESPKVINQEHRFLLVIKNDRSSLTKIVLKFGGRYLKVRDIDLQSNVSDNNTISSAHHLSIEFQPNETKQVSFSTTELIHNDPELFTVKLLSEEQMRKNEQFLYTTQAFFFGVFGFLCLFNLALFFFTKWTVYLKYSLYIFLSLLYFSYFHGFLQVIFPSIANASNNLIQIWYSLIFIAYFYFVNDFGQYKVYAPKAYKLLNFGIVFKLIESSINSILHFSGSQFIYSFGYRYGILAFEIVLMLLIIYNVVKNKNLRGRLVISASFILIAGGILDQLVVIKGFEHCYFIEIAVILELFTFSIALGYLSRWYQRDSLKSQKLYAKQIELNENIKSELKESPDGNSSFLKLGHSYKKICFSDILYLEADGSYCKIHTTNGNLFTMSMNLQKTANQLNSSYLLKTHRSFIVNTMFVDEYSPKSVIIRGNTIPVSKTHSQDLLDALKNI